MKDGYQEPGDDKSPITYTKSPEQLAKDEEQRKAMAAKAAAAKAAADAKAKEAAAAKAAEEANNKDAE
jgi:hypothetical protein